MFVGKTGSLPKSGAGRLRPDLQMLDYVGKACMGTNTHCYQEH
jgi:hypothetical protein